MLCYSSTGGTCAQRVAARLIPRFSARFPQQLEGAAAALIAITGSHSSTKDPEAVRALSKAARPEALNGLATVNRSHCVYTSKCCVCCHVGAAVSV